MGRASLVATLILLGAAAGCAVEPTPESQTEAALGFANDQAAYEFFIGKGLTSFQAAGIVGNLDQESGVDPHAVQYGGGPGRGIAQWSVGGRWDTSANDNVLDYAASRGESSGSLHLQLEFIWYELTTYGYGYAQLRATTNLTDATLVFMDLYEICGQCESSQRIAYAQDVLDAYGATPAYAAGFVSQSWPYASMPAFTLHCGERIDAQIVLTNMGTNAWDDSTRLGTTMPRDRASLFAGDDWVAPNRAAAIQGTVGPGDDGTFAFSFHGPTGEACVPGVYEEYFGIVEDGVAWFSDSGNGGPPDDQIEALIDLEPGDGTMGGSDDGAGDDGMGSDGTGSDGMPGGPGMGGCDAGGGGGAGGLAVLALLGLVTRERRAPRRRA